MGPVTEYDFEKNTYEIYIHANGFALTATPIPPRSIWTWLTAPTSTQIIKDHIEKLKESVDMLVTGKIFLLEAFLPLFQRYTNSLQNVCIKKAIKSPEIDKIVPLVLSMKSLEFVRKEKVDAEKGAKEAVKNAEKEALQPIFSGMPGIVDLITAYGMDAEDMSKSSDILRAEAKIRLLLPQVFQSTDKQEINYDTVKEVQDHLREGTGKVLGQFFIDAQGDLSKLDPNLRAVLEFKYQERPFRDLVKALLFFPVSPTAEQLEAILVFFPNLAKIGIKWTQATQRVAEKLMK